MPLSSKFFKKQNWDETHHDIDDYYSSDFLCHKSSLMDRHKKLG